MSPGSDVTRDGLVGVRPGREATVGPVPGGRAEPGVVPDARFASYYGRPVLHRPVWRSPDVPGYLFLGGLAGGSSVLAAAADLTGRPALARASKLAAAGGIGLGVAALVHDLGRPARFANMLRTFKPTSPMSVGSWLLAGYAPAATVAAASGVTGRWPRLGRAATAGSAALGPLVASYTGALLADTAVPAWHGGYRELPFLFVGSALTAAAGWGLAAAPPAESGPLRWLAAIGGTVELVSARLLRWRLGELAEPYHRGRAGTLRRAGEALTAAGVAAGLLPGRGRRTAVAAGAGLLTAAALTRFGVFQAGLVSADTPEHTVGPQRQRLPRRVDGAGGTG